MLSPSKRKETDLPSRCDIALAEWTEMKNQLDELVSGISLHYDYYDKCSEESKQLLNKIQSVEADINQFNDDIAKVNDDIRQIEEQLNERVKGVKHIMSLATSEERVEWHKWMTN
mmetsp:Transcript_11692/g.23477  ORF Transcript_11692/g.23477 Transcript_11692/m.23477 type:complete len:115 (-) Transcript_11692:134-478(-)